MKGEGKGEEGKGLEEEGKEVEGTILPLAVSQFDTPRKISFLCHCSSQHSQCLRSDSCQFYHSFLLKCLVNFGFFKSFFLLTCLLLTWKIAVKMYVCMCAV